MGLLRWFRRDRTRSVTAVGIGMEMVHALFNGNKHVQVAERKQEKRVGKPNRLSPGDPGAGPLDLPDEWKRPPEQ
ncbi:MAG: hypothetical protein IPK24_11730 [Kineosporiaceae bacterium]|nr:hypothetical protein [Kineosporiaceae bacterium]